MDEFIPHAEPEPGATRMAAEQAATKKNKSADRSQYFLSGCRLLEYDELPHD
jgi:hypothetical protein